MTIETKINKNGAKLYYIDGKRVSKQAALDAQAELDNQIDDEEIEVEDEEQVEVDDNDSTDVNEDDEEDVNEDDEEDVEESEDELNAELQEKINDLNSKGNADINRAEIRVFIAQILVKLADINLTNAYINGNREQINLAKFAVNATAELLNNKVAELDNAREIKAKESDESYNNEQIIRQVFTIEEAFKFMSDGLNVKQIAQLAKNIIAEREQAILEVTVSQEALEVATNAEIELANADNTDDNGGNGNVDTANILPTGDITVNCGAAAWAIVGKHFPNGLYFNRASKGFNREDVFSFTYDEIIYANATCTPDNRRVECIEVINSNESGSARHVLSVCISHDFNNEVDTDNNTDNNVNNEVSVESAQANGLTQEQEEMAFQAHKLKMKIDALKNGILHREDNINGNVVTINDILNNHWKPNTNDGYEEWANELAAEIAHDLNKITTLQAQLAALTPNTDNAVDHDDYAVTSEAQDAATDAEIQLANSNNDNNDDSNGTNIATDAEMKVETKINKNGAKLYYVDGKRVSRELALQTAANIRKTVFGKTVFTVEYYIGPNPFLMGRILDSTQKIETTTTTVIKSLQLEIDDPIARHGFFVQLHTFGFTDICQCHSKDAAKSVINKIENAFIRGDDGVKVDKHGNVSILTFGSNVDIRREIVLPELARLEGRDDYIYQPQTNWVNPHDFTVTGDLSDRNLNGRITAQRQLFNKEEVTLTDNFNAKLAELKANAERAKANLAEKQAALDKAQQDSLQADYALENAIRAVNKLGDAKAKELRSMLKNSVIADNTYEMIITTQDGKQLFSNLKSVNINFESLNIDFDDGFFIALDLPVYRKLAFYPNPEQVTCAVNLLIDAIKRGASEFTFPTADELKPQEPTNKQINDSLIRAMETNLKNIQAHLLNNDINAAVAELNLYHICDNALLRKEVA